MDSFIVETLVAEKHWSLSQAIVPTSQSFVHFSWDAEWKKIRPWEPSYSKQMHLLAEQKIITV